MKKFLAILILILIPLNFLPAFAQASTRAEQIEFLKAGVTDPDDGTVLAAGTVYFYEVGTTTGKNVWTEETKTNAYTSYALDNSGAAALYGDGSYKIVVKDSGGTTKYTFAHEKYGSPITNTRTVSTTDTADSDDDIIVLNGTFTLSLDDVANFTEPLFLIRIGGTITVDPYSTQTIGADSTITLSATNTSIVLYPDTDSSIWREANKFAGYDILDEDDMASDSASDIPTQQSVKAYVDTYAPIVGDGSVAGAKLRMARLTLDNGTNASTVKMTLGNLWNGDALAATDNMTDGGTSNYMQYNEETTYVNVRVDEDGLSDAVIWVIGAVISRNFCATHLTPTIANGSNDISINLYQAPAGSNIDLRTLVDTGLISIDILYLTQS